MQQECIPQAVLGSDIICVAKSGMGKTAVFVLSVLQQIVPEDGVVDTIVLCHTRELAFQICQEFHRLAKYLPAVKVRAPAQPCQARSQCLVPSRTYYISLR